MGTIQVFLEALKFRIKQRQPDWQPEAFIVENSNAETAAIRGAFGWDQKIYLCWFHVMRNWSEKASKLEMEFSRRKCLLDTLKGIMHWNPGAAADAATVDAGLMQQVDAMSAEFFRTKNEANFLSYFQKEYLQETAGTQSKRFMWANCYRNVNLKGCNTTNHVEGYHTCLKSMLDMTKIRLSTRRLDWPLHTLLAVVLPYFQDIVASRHVGMVCNDKAEGEMQAAVLKALEIPEDYLVLVDDSMAVTVRSSGDKMCCTM